MSEVLKALKANKVVDAVRDALIPLIQDPEFGVGHLGTIARITKQAQKLAAAFDPTLNLDERLASASGPLAPSSSFENFGATLVQEFAAMLGPLKPKPEPKLDPVMVLPPLPQDEDLTSEDLDTLMRALETAEKGGMFAEQIRLGQLRDMWVRKQVQKLSSKLEPKPEKADAMVHPDLERRSAVGTSSGQPQADVADRVEAEPVRTGTA